MNFTQLHLEQLPQWADLLAISFDRHPVDMIELLTYLQSTNGLTAWGAWDGRHLVGQYSCLHHHIQLAQDIPPARVGMSINMAVHPDYRGRGLVKQLAGPVYDHIKQEGAIAGVGFSNAEGVQVDRYSKKYGYQILGKMQSVLAWVVRKPRQEPLFLSSTWPERPFVDTSKQPGIHFYNTPAQLKLRFANHPFRSYQFGIWQDEEAVRGIVVFRRFKRGKLKGISLLTAWGDDLPTLLESWLSALWQEGCRMVHLLTTPHSKLKGALMQTTVCLPLPYSRTPYYLTVKPLCANYADALIDFTQWDCHGGDIL